jgi:peptidoglycan/xylan/chitin deacetylase (PgdA/CDA1 family)
VAIAVGSYNYRGYPLGYALTLMSYFDFSFSKVTRLLLLVAALVGATTYFALSHPNFTVAYVNDSSGNYYNRTKAALSYWWSYKLELGADMFASANPVMAIASPAVLAFRTVAKEISPQQVQAINGAADEAASGSQSIPVLLYHGESDTSQTLPLNAFIDQLKTLKANGWQTITMSQFYSYVKSGAKLPEKSFLLTFDDGRKDSYYPTDPVLADLGYSAVMFVITGFSFPANNGKSTFYLSKTELENMQNSDRWELESHGKEDHVFYNVDAQNTEGHFLSNKLWLPDQSRTENESEFTDRVTSDLEAAKTTLEKDFGKPVIGFAYPFSDYGENSINFNGSGVLLDKIIPSIYDLAFYQSTPTDGDSFNYPNSGTYLVKRIEPGPNWSGQDLLNVLASGKAKTLPYSQNTFGGEWVHTWGSVISENMLKLSALKDTTGAAAFLDGSGSWTDYKMTATVAKKSGESIMLAAREVNSRNYFLCTFSADRVSIRETLNGVSETVKSAGYKTDATDSPTYGISASGDTLGCYVNGTEVVHYDTMSPALRKGGVGIQIWDPTEGVANATISSIKVTPIE